MSYLARVSYTGNGSTTQYALPFTYIATSHIQAFINNVQTTAFTVSGSTLTFTSAPANSAAILIKRVTPTDARLVDFQDGSVLTESDLDKSADQNFFVAQESSDDMQSKLGLDNSSLWDADNKRIINVATAVASTDAANKAYVDAVAGSATAAAASEAAAANSASAAENSNVSAAALLDTFDDAFLGSKSSDPSTDNDGDALTDGDLYYNTTDNRMKVYDLGTTSWLYVSPSSADQTKINNVSDNIAAITSVNTNMQSVQNFADVYRIASSAPNTSLNVGDLYFDTTANELKVYKSSGWAAAGSTVNGTAQRYTYNITGTPNSVSGADAKGDTLAYDAGFVDVYLNGVRLSNSSGSYTGDVTVSSGNSVVFANNLAAGDVVDVVAYGTFSVATVAASAITSGTIAEARLPASALGAVWESKNANFTAEARKNYFVDTTSNAVDVTLPSGTIGDEIHFLDVSGTFDTNDLTILYGSSKIQGASANLDVSTERAGFTLVYYNSTQGWLLKDK
jgi:hypothetical protein